MAKILIVSVSAGSGHVRAANAIEAYLENQGHTIKHVDLMDYSKKWFKNIYADKYIDLINNHPKVWKLLFDITDKPTKKSVYKTRRWFEYKLHKKFFDMLGDFQPEHIISTHFMPPEILVRFKEKYLVDFQIYVAVTDFDVHQLWVHPEVDHFFVAGNLAKNKLLENNIHPHDITISGIPISPQFFKQFNKEELLKKYNLSNNKKTLLLMAGGAGVGNLDIVSEEILNNFNDIQIIALPGKNNQLLDKLLSLKQVYGDRLNSLGFTNEVHELMYLADLVVTKPGGLSTSECISLKKPMLLINPIPGQEEFNAHNIESLGLGKLSSNIIADVKYMMENLETYQNSFNNIQTYDTQNIYQQFFKDII